MRKNGFYVRVDLFIPADMKDRAKARQVMDAIDKIERGEPQDVLELGIVLKVDSKFTSRDVPDAPDEGQQLDIEDAALTADQAEDQGRGLPWPAEAIAEDAEQAPRSRRRTAA